MPQLRKLCSEAVGNAERLVRTSVLGWCRGRCLEG